MKQKMICIGIIGLFFLMGIATVTAQEANVDTPNKPAGIFTSCIYGTVRNFQNEYIAGATVHCRGFGMWNPIWKKFVFDQTVTTGQDGVFWIGRPGPIGESYLPCPGIYTVTVNADGYHSGFKIIPRYSSGARATTVLLIRNK